MSSATTRIDLDAIERDATKATPGPYSTILAHSERDGSSAVMDGSRTIARLSRMVTPGGKFLHNRDATHIANCDPQTILALVRAVRGAVAYAEADDAHRDLMSGMSLSDFPSTTVEISATRLVRTLSDLQLAVAPFQPERT